MPKGRGQQSTIDTLPDEVKAVLDGYLRDKKITQKEATRRTNLLLEELGHPQRVSKSAVNRYSQDMEEAGAHLRESREVAKQWIGSLGAVPQGEVGLLVNEIIRTMSFDVSLFLRRGTLDGETAPETVKMLKDLALTMMRLEKAASDNLKRDAEIKKNALEDAARTMSRSAKQAGVSEETIQIIRRDVLRMAS